MMPNGSRLLSEFQGSDWDSRLTAAITWFKAQPAGPKIAVELDAGEIGPFKTGRIMPNGWHLFGPDGMGTDQVRKDKPYQSEVNVQGDGAWWNTPVGTMVNDVRMGRFSMEGQYGKNCLIATPGGGWIQSSLFRDIGITNVKSGLGTEADQLRLQACTFDGDWTFANYSDCAWNIGGSDSDIFWGSYPLVDTPVSLMKGAFHTYISHLSESRFGPWYQTCEGPAGALRISGSDAVAGTVISGPHLEGRNATHPNTAPVMVECVGGTYVIIGMSTNSPNATGTAVVRVSGGEYGFDWHQYRKDNAPESLPLYLVTGGRARIKNVLRGGGGWDGLPRVKRLGGAVSVDDSVQLV